MRLNNPTNKIMPIDENGERHGESIGYHKNGKLEYRSNWFHGVIHGLNEGYHEDGTLRYRGNWNMGRYVGYWCIYEQKKYHLWLI